MTQRKSSRRRRQFVDSEVQTVLMWQCVLHWGLFILGAFVLLFLLHIMTGSANRPLRFHLTSLWNQYGLIVLVLLALLPVFILDLVKLTNRFVGPIVQLRKTIRAVARGEQVKPLRFRKGDFWMELADEFNTILKLAQPPLEANSPTEEAADSIESASEPPLVAVKN